MKQLCVAALAAALGASMARADEIQLTNGHKITGKVSHQDANRLVVEVGPGTIVLDAKEVSSVNPGRTALDEYAEKWDRIKGSRNVGEFLSLAQWAEEKGLTRYSTPLYGRVIELEPDNAVARGRLHFEKMGGKWLTFEEAQAARGLVFMEDRWMTKAELQLIEKRRLEARERAEAVALERQKRREEERAARQAALDDYNARMNAVMSQLDGYFYSPSFAFTTPYYRPYWWAPYLRSRNYYQHAWATGYGVIPTLPLVHPPFAFTR